MTELITLENISKYYTIGKKKKLAALQNISFGISKGETLGIVGESGSGKSTLARIIMGIEQPDHGRILYDGEPLCTKKTKDRLAFARKAQIIFQDPFASLDPRMTIEAILTEGMEIQKMLDKSGRKERAAELLNMVGLETEHAARYPYEFSGGQRQRIGIARALAVTPEFLVCDEPISALDVSVQSHIMTLLKELRDHFHLTCLFIAHDLNMVNYISDRIAVIYAGEIVELGSSTEICQHPQHPYTKFLLDCVLIPDPAQKSLDAIPLRGTECIPQDHSRSGCSFAPHCPIATASCGEHAPLLQEVAPGHYTACLGFTRLADLYKRPSLVPVSKKH